MSWNPRWARIFIAALLFALPARAAERARFFTPHLSAPAATVGPGGIAFQGFPGANGLQGFLLNALDIGIGSRIEAGSAPFFWLIKEHRYNFNAKWNFWKARDFHLAAGISKFAYRTASTLSDGSPAIPYNYDLLYWVGAANLFLTDSVALGVNLAKPNLSSDSPELSQAIGQDTKIEWIVDIAFRLHERLAFTPGFGELRLDTLNPKSPVPFGYGATFTWTRYKGTMGRISFGAHHLPKLRETKAIFSFSIF